MTTETKLNGKRGTALLQDPALNKSTAFTSEERESLGLVGLLPEGLEDEETQIKRVMEQLEEKTTDIDKFIYLSALQDNNENAIFQDSDVRPRSFYPAGLYANGRRSLSKGLDIFCDDLKDSTSRLLVRDRSKRFCNIGRKKMCALSLSPTANGF